MRKNHHIAPAILIAAVFAVGSAAWGASATVEMYIATKDGRGEKLGDVAVEESRYGLVFKPNLAGLIPGAHGFHIHANGSCAPGPDANTGETIAAGAAGGHFDPKNTKSHGLPWDEKSHMGDLPLLYVDKDGKAASPVLAPKLKSLDQVRGLALMIHEGGDNYSDTPKPLGGGGGRMACGILQ